MRIPKRYVPILLALSLILWISCSNRERTQPAAPTPLTETAERQPTPSKPVVMPTGASALQMSEAGLDLVFSGGGAKGIAHIGALMELEKRGLTYRRVVGTSSGSIMALMLAAGYNTDEMVAAITERTPDGKIIMASFLDTPASFSEEVIHDSFLYTLIENAILSDLPDPFKSEARKFAVEELMASPVIREAFAFTEYGGVYTGDVFLQWLNEKLDQNGRQLSQLSLSEFHQETGSDLTAIITDINDQRMLVVNHRTAPDLPVSMLIRMSMSIPLVYKNVIWQPEWGTYAGEDISGHEIVDGGIGSNFGIEMVVSQDSQFVDAMGMEPDRKRVIGLYLNDAIPVPGGEQDASEPERNMSSLQNGWDKVTKRNIDLFNAVLRSHDQFIIRTHPDIVCHLPVGGVGTMEFDMSDARIALLLHAGQEAMAGCLDALDMGQGYP
ncbi:MAG: patatin-like phospholipase family protein [Candidatus Promineifilaceae bacterium]|nr:patatin-like phospholipase family protein [Candidatus Promineifilaceae bacterium]